jgi:hypothetical protein
VPSFGADAIGWYAGGFAALLGRADAMSARADCNICSVQPGLLATALTAFCEIWMIDINAATFLSASSHRF